MALTAVADTAHDAVVPSDRWGPALIAAALVESALSPAVAYARTGRRVFLGSPAAPHIGPRARPLLAERFRARGHRVYDVLHGTAR